MFTPETDFADAQGRKFEDAESLLAAGSDYLGLCDCGDPGACACLALAALQLSSAERFDLFAQVLAECPKACAQLVCQFMSEVFGCIQYGGSARSGWLLQSPADAPECPGNPAARRALCMAMASRQLEIEERSLGAMEKSIASCPESYAELVLYCFCGPMELIEENGLPTAKGLRFIENAAAMLADGRLSPRPEIQSASEKALLCAASRPGSPFLPKTRL